MIQTHLKKYYKNYLFLLFIMGSFVLSTIYEKKGINIYYVIALVVFILGFTNCSFIKELGLSFKTLKDKKTYIFIIPVIILSNFLLVLIQKKYMYGGNLSIKSDFNYNLLLSFLFIASIRILGEEFIFRGFLLIKSLNQNNKLFWLLNIAQAIIFSFIHTTFVDELNSKIVFGSYVFVLSVYFAWLNRKFNSILPSFIVHWMNGLGTFIFTYN